MRRIYLLILTLYFNTINWKSNKHFNVVMVHGGRDYLFHFKYRPNNFFLKHLSEFILDTPGFSHMLCDKKDRTGQKVTYCIDKKGSLICDIYYLNKCGYEVNMKLLVEESQTEKLKL